GYDHLVRVTPDAMSCGGGGFLVQGGYDENRNGILEATEVDTSELLCTGDGDGDGVANHLDNCTGVVNPSQIDQDGDGVGDVCDSSPCLGPTCMKNCTMLFESGQTLDGRYAIDPSGSQPVIAQCDMSAEGG